MGSLRLSLHSQNQIIADKRENAMNKKTVSTIGLVIAAAFLVFGFFMKVPEKKISFYASEDDGGYREYVGGDAYNIQIEASLRGGEIAGAKTMKAVLLAAGGIIAIISLYGFVEEDTSVNYEIKKQIEGIKKSVDEIQKRIPTQPTWGELDTQGEEKAKASQDTINGLPEL